VPREESQRSKGDSFRFLEESTRRRASRVKKSRRRFFSRVAEKEKTRMRRFLVPG
jgi:hypothetical protein